jgi:hypothetical protein
MQEIGTKVKNGLTLDELMNAKAYFETQGKTCELIDLSTITPKKDTFKFPKAYLLVVRKAFSNSKEIYDEQCQFERDKKALMYGRVVNKHARHNLCFSDFDQVADFEQGKGTVIHFDKLPLLSAIRKGRSPLYQSPVGFRKLWPEIIKSDKVKDLQCEANYYYDIKKTYIGFHGDTDDPLGRGVRCNAPTERRIVIGVRLGARFPIHYQWYKNAEKVSELFTDDLDDGDVYVMSDKAVGYDWKQSSIYSLRHAAGNEKLVCK